MSLVFEPVTKKKQDQYLKFLDACPLKSSDYSFVNLWSWADTHGLMWAWDSNLVWIKQTRPHEAYWAPVGAWTDVNWVESFAATIRNETTFVRVPEDLVTIWGNIDSIRITSVESRGHWDYLYSVSDLTRLGGNRFHKKKNLLNQFKKKYAFRYATFTDEMIQMALDMQESWCEWRDCEAQETLDAENRAIAKVLNNWQQLKRLKGGAIMVESEMVAYTVAEQLTADTLLIHFEKGSSEFKGVYQAINQMFLEHEGSGFQLVNREQDLDNEGLRKAKQSYNPVGFIKKYSVDIAH